MILLPLPQKVEERRGRFFLGEETPLLYDCRFGTLGFELLRMLGEDLRHEFGFENTKAAVAHPDGREMYHFPSILFSFKEGMKDEAYTLEVEEDGITLEASTYIGAVHALQTLRQILKQEGLALPCLRIEDEPYFEHRGYYHDITRSRVPTLDFMKRLVDILSYYKYNEFQLYIEHTYLFQEFSSVWRDDTPLTSEEILELDRYCETRGIELIPSLTTFGHFYKILSDPVYEDLCELENSSKEEFSFVLRQMHHTLDVSNPKAFPFVCRMIDEYIPLFRSRKFNIGADETFDLGTGKSKELCEKLGKSRLYIDFVKKVADYVISKGSRPMFWGDVIAEFPEMIKELPESIICLNWGYLPNQREEETIRLDKAGATQYLCPGVGGWNQFINLMQSAYSNIRIMTEYAVRHNAMGILNTDWGDMGHINDPMHSLPGLIYGGVFSWRGSGPAFEDLNEEISRFAYGDSSGRLVSVLARMNETQTMCWVDMVRFKEAPILQPEMEVEEARKQKLREIDREDFANKVQRLKALRTELRELSGCMSTEGRRELQPMLLGSEALLLMSETYAVLWKHFFGEDILSPEDFIEAKPLAEAWELWYRAFKRRWNKVSKPSELYRAERQIFWFADYLRAL